MSAIFKLCAVFSVGKLSFGFMNDRMNFAQNDEVHSGKLFFQTELKYCIF